MKNKKQASVYNSNRQMRGPHILDRDQTLALPSSEIKIDKQWLFARCLTKIKLSNYEKKIIVSLL